METSRQYDRFKDAPWFSHESKDSILVGGAGGISSWLTFFLCRAGFDVIVYDNDIIEQHNIGGQLYRIDDIGKKKVVALQDILADFSETSISTIGTWYDENSINHRYMMCGFDNMLARKVFFQKWKQTVENSMWTPILIDGRLEMENLQIFCVTKETMDLYEQEYLFDDSIIEDAPCSLRQTTHSAAMIASHMVGFLTNHITNVKEGEVVREIPFFYEYFIPMNLTI